MFVTEEPEKYKHFLIGKLFGPDTWCCIYNVFNEIPEEEWDNKLTWEVSKVTCPKCLERIKIYEDKFGKIK